jgi:hypothetical protein
LGAASGTTGPSRSAGPVSPRAATLTRIVELRAFRLHSLRVTCSRLFKPRAYACGSSKQDAPCGAVAGRRFSPYPRAIPCFARRKPVLFFGSVLLFRRSLSLGAARPFGLWTTRSASWLPIKRRRDPGLGPLFNVAWLRRDSNLGQVGTRVQRLSVRRIEPYRPHLTAMRRSRQAVAPCAC